jgi:hypothetical protein
MKTLLFSLLLLLPILRIQAQAPQQFSFQGVARNATGQAVANTNVGLRLTIHETSPADIVIYRETHHPQTTSGGVFTVSVGGGQAESGLFANINWKSGTFFLQVELDPAGGSNYTDLGATQLLSVPYALHAAQADQWKNGDPVVQKGTYDAGENLVNVGIGPRLIWYPKKAAFRAGFTGADYWDDTNTGFYSTAFGENTKAFGGGSFAAGVLTSSPGYASASFGYATVSKAFASVSLGSYNNEEGSLDNIEADTDRIFQIGNGYHGNRKNALTLLRNGNLGLGSNVLHPEYVLDIGARARIRHNVNKTAGLFFDDSNNHPEGFVGMRSDNEIGFFNGDKWSFWMDNAGNAHIAGSNYNTSDARLKKDLSPLVNSLAKLSALRGYQYFWKDSTKDQTVQTGLIAQEVETSFPELVKTDDQGYKSINYMGLIPHLIESVKELKLANQELKASVEKLRIQNADANPAAK